MKRFLAFAASLVFAAGLSAQISVRPADIKPLLQGQVLGRATVGSGGSEPLDFRGTDGETRAVFSPGGLTISLPTALNFTGKTITGGTFTGGSFALSTLTFGTHLTGTSYNGSAPITIATDAASANTVSTIVARDASGNFSAGTITATLNGAAPAGSLTGTTLAANVVTSSLTSAAGGLFGGAAYKNGLLVNVKDYGAYGDYPTHDDTTAIQAAVTYAVANGRAVYLPAGNYKISAALDLTAGHISFVGENRNTTSLTQVTSNTQVIKLGGSENIVSDLTLTYSTAQAAVNTLAIGIEFYAVDWSVLERLTINNSAYGMLVKQAAVSSGSNWIFSCTLRDIIVQYYTLNGLNLVGYNGGISGNVVSNVYILGRDSGGTATNTNEAIVLGAWTDGVFDQINIESTNPTEAIYLNTCDSTVWNALHFESVTPRTDFGGFVDASTGCHTFTDVSFSTSTINTAGGVYAFRASGINTKFVVTGLKESGSTVTSPMFRIFGLPGTETGCQMRLISGNYSGFTSAGSSTSTPSAILSVNDVYNSLTDGGLTADRVTFAGTGGLLSDDSDLTFSGDTLTATKLLTNSVNKVAITAPATSSTLTIANGKTLTASNTLTFTGTDSSSVNFGAGGTVLYSGGSFVSSLAGTANEITASASTGAVTLSLPSALTFTGKTVTGGTFTGLTAVTAGTLTSNVGAITSAFNSAGSHFVAYRNTPTGFGYGGGYDFATQNSSSAQFTQARILARTGDNTAGVEDGQIWFETRNAGAATTALKLIGNGTAQFQVGLSTPLIVGVTTGSAAAAGNVGQVISSAIASGSAVSLTTATGANVTSISLTAGDWDVSGNVNFAASTATVTGASGGVTSTSATVPTDGTEVYSGVQVTLVSENDSVTIPHKQINVSSTTTIYLVGKCTFSAGTVGAFGAITARRVR